MVLAALFLVGLFGVLALAVDCGMISLARTELQRTADAAALAGTGALYDPHLDVDVDTAYEAVYNSADFNAFGASQVKLVEQDIILGKYDFDTGRVTSDTFEPDAIQVLASRRADRGNAVRTFFAPIFGVNGANAEAVAIAYVPPVSRTRGVPMALRAPTFGPVDPKVAEKNPGKDGPSYPLNDVKFEIGEKVTLLSYGKGKKPTIHLSLQTEADGVPVDKGVTQEILRGERDSPWMQVGDEYAVHNEGSGSSSLPGSLDDRLAAPTDDPSRSLVIPIVETIPGSRGADGFLSGKVRVVDFVAVHLDGIEEVLVPDPAKEGRMIDIEILVGTVIKARVISALVPRDAQAPNGMGGGSVISRPFLVR